MINLSIRTHVHIVFVFGKEETIVWRNVRVIFRPESNLDFIRLSSSYIVRNDDLPPAGIITVGAPFNSIDSENQRWDHDIDSDDDR